jgi:hypothetical protein
MALWLVRDGSEGEHEERCLPLEAARNTGLAAANGRRLGALLLRRYDSPHVLPRGEPQGRHLHKQFSAGLRRAGPRWRQVQSHFEQGGLSLDDGTGCANNARTREKVSGSSPSSSLSSAASSSARTSALASTDSSSGSPAPE